MLIFPNVRSFPLLLASVLVALATVLGTAPSVRASPYGLTSAEAIGAYLNGNLPATTPGQNGTPEAPALLSAVAAFSSLATLEPVTGLIPYDLNSPLWSDGSTKKRWLAVPNNGSHNSAAEQIAFSEDGNWTFPIGSVLVKHFDLPVDDADPTVLRRLETRFIVHGSDGVHYGLTYRWRPDGSEADLLTTGQDETITIATTGGGTRTQVWSYPSRADCMSCHNTTSGAVLGPRTHQFNRDLLYAATGVTDNQLRALGNIGLFSTPYDENAIASYLKSVHVSDTTASLEDRSRSYLSANCSHCHQPGATNAYFDARFETPLPQQNLLNGPLLYSNGVSGAHVLTPTSVPQSMAHIRMASLAAEKMPPVGKNVVDSAAIAVIESWINSLPPTGSGPNSAPVAADDSGATIFETAITLNVLDNDVDSDTDPLIIHSVGQGANGSVTINGDNSVTYTPDAGFDGYDYFGYEARDPSGAISNTATVTISVAADGADGAIGFSNESSLLSVDARSGVAMAIADMNADGLDDIVRYHLAKQLMVEFQDPAGGTFGHYAYGTVGSRTQWGVCVGDVDENGINDIISGGYYDGLKYFQGNATGSAWTKFTLGGPTLFLQTVNFADIDMDGDIDVFACHDDADSHQYRNNGGTLALDNSMMDSTTIINSDNSGNYGTVWTDYDADGDLDMYMSKCRGGVSSPSDPRRINMLFENDGNGNYTKVAAAAGLDFGEQSWATDFADIDHDGDMDCYVGNHYATSYLMLNNGDGTFTDITPASGITPFNWKVIQVVFRDFNNDTWDDLLITGAEHILYLNDGASGGGKTFSAVANPFGSNWIESCAVGDLNHDGFVDVYAGYANLYNSPSSTKTDRLYLNDGNSNHYLGVQLEGVASNRNAIGARLELYGPWGVMVREVRAGESYGIQHSMSCHFGLGGNAQASSLVVKWPSGAVDTITNPTGDQYLFIKEGSSAPPVVTTPGAQLHWADEAVNLQITASDPTGDTLIYSAANLPAGLSIDTASGLISGTLGNASPGLYTTLITATDELGSNASSTFSWEVRSVLERYDGWAANTPGAGSSPLHNNDGDLLNDLMEFALGADPASGATAGIGLFIDDSGTGIDVLYVRPASLEGASYAVEASSNLSNWFDLSAPTITTNSDGTETVRYSGVQNSPAVSQISGFVRLRAELASPSATAHTIPIGWCNTPLPVGTGTYGAPLPAQPVFIGRISSLAGGVLGFSYGSPAASMQAGKEYYLEIAGGPREGHRVEIDTATTSGSSVGLDLNSPRSTLNTIGNDLLQVPVIIRAHTTLDDLYPPTAFVGSSDPAQADQVQSFNGSGYETYFLLSVGSYLQWTHIADTQIADAGTTVIEPGRGVFFRKRDNDGSCGLTGEVRCHAFAQPLQQGFNLVANPFPIATTPTTRGILISDGFYGSMSPAQCDQIQAFRRDIDPNLTGYNTCFLLDAGNGSGLQYWTSSADSSLQNLNDELLFKPDRAVFLKIHQAAGNPDYIVPLPWNPLQ